MRFTFTEANLLPDNHPENVRYNDFLSLFGEEGNVIVIAVKDESLFTPEKLSAWNALSKKLNGFDEIDFVLSLENLQVLTKNTSKGKFELEPLLTNTNLDSTGIKQLKQRLFLNCLFLKTYFSIPLQKVYEPESICGLRS